MPDGGIPRYPLSKERFIPTRSVSEEVGAVGQHGSIAVLERFIGTLKRECIRRVLVPIHLHRASLQREFRLFAGWYNEHRPSMALGGCTPHEIYHDARPTNRQPRIEPRSRWPRRSRCAAPRTLVAGTPGARFELDVQLLNGRSHLPVVTLKRAA